MCISPTVDAEYFKVLLKNINHVCKKHSIRDLILAGDFNSRYKVWDKINNYKGKILHKWIIKNELILINEPCIPTCRRSQGVSTVDLTLVTSSIAGRISGWRVLDNEESLSDHLYIEFQLGDKADRHTHMENYNNDIKRSRNGI